MTFLVRMHMSPGSLVHRLVGEPGYEARLTASCSCTMSLTAAAEI